jgi:phosphoribosylanthranilate isomerase
MLSGGISHDDAERIAEAMRPGMVGVDVNSRFETAPGIKDVELLSNFIKSLEYEPTKISL